MDVASRNYLDECVSSAEANQQSGIRAQKSAGVFHIAYAYDWRGRKWNYQKCNKFN